MRLVVRILTSLVPLAMAPGFFWLLAEGYLNLGGGEKDIVMVLPWMIWSVLYAIAFLWSSRKQQPFRRHVMRALAWATGLTVSLLLLMTLSIFVSEWLEN